MDQGRNQSRVYSYYPGCTLKTKGKELDQYARSCGELLNVKLEELSEWQCCGGVYPMANDEIATRLASVRALNQAKEQQRSLVTVCSACHHVMKRVNDDMLSNQEINAKANNYLALEAPYQGETKVLHYLEVLRDEVTFEALKKQVVSPLKGRKIGAYYGCLLLRPSSVMNFDDAENPRIMEDFITALGAEPVIYPARNECCGGYISLKEAQLAAAQAEKIIEDALYNGAEELITTCPLCLYSLSHNGSSQKIPVRYFTELLAEALDVKGGDEA